MSPPVIITVEGSDSEEEETVANPWATGHTASFEEAYSGELSNTFPTINNG